MKSEPTQTGNPYELSLLQHIFPSRSISRFCKEDGLVDIYMFQQQKRRSARPNDKIFWARRKWDERAEKGYGKEIEDEFQNVVDRILQSKGLLSPSDKFVITRLYALWNCRYYWSKVPMNDIPIKGVKGTEFSLTLDSQERLEKNHIICPAGDHLIVCQTT